MVDFKAKIKDVPDNPGVYMMLDEQGQIIYVGKAKNLKNRLRSYFFNLSNRTAKVMAMLEHVADFRYIICASEVDALLTENNLIKKHSPRYNILLKRRQGISFFAHRQAGAISDNRACAQAQKRRSKVFRTLHAIRQYT